MRKPAFVLFLLAFSLSAHAQNLERYNWYFGNSAQAIRFNRTTIVPSIVPKAVPFGAGGSSTASNPSNANLLFYTDGNNVFDATNLIMPNGNGLTATAASNQPTVVCPVPGQANKYFIFTNTASFPAGGSISVSVVDMALFGNAPFPTPALGDIETKNVAVPGLVNRSEGMIIIPDDNGIDFYLITQQINSQNYSVTVIDAGSYTGTYVTTTISGIALPTSIGNFAYHAGTGRIAASAQDTNTDAIILTFDNTNGTLAFDRFIFNSGMPTATNQSIYDIEFSTTGQYLYLSRHGEAGIQADVLQYDYANPTTTLTSILAAPVFRSYGLQMAPDSMIYHLYQNAAAGPFLLGRLGDTDSVAAKVIYSPAVLTATSLAGKQFSNFAPASQAPLTVDFTFAGTCENMPTTFFPNVTPQADSLNWDFGDTFGSNAWSPIHQYGPPQPYPVTLTAFFHGVPQSTTKTVTIGAFPLQLQLVQDTTACRSEFPPPRGTSSPVQFSVTVKVQGGTPTSHIWSNGDLGPKLTPDSAGYYYVVVTDASGCAAYAGVNVKEYGQQDQRANVWYFGNHAGIDFNESPPLALSNSAMDAPEGCAIICDRNGKPVFYTDGDKVYDKTDTQIAAGIGGDPLASQSSIVVPVPGDETLYYIFTNQSVNGGSSNQVTYSLFDIKQNGGLGAVVQQNVPLFMRSTERITASGSWLIIHESGNNSFLAYPITQAGIGIPVVTAIGSDHLTTPLENNEGYMKLGPNNLLAVALNTPGVSNLVELFTLVDSSGVLINYRKIDLNQPAGQVYGIEFSAGGNKVFATVKSSPGPSELYEYFLDSLGGPHKKQVISQMAELGALQMGPDGTIYVAVNGTGSDFLGTISAQDDTTQFSSFILNGFALAASTNSRLGLPNFIQQISNATGGPDIDVSGVCFGKPTTFVGTPTDAIDHFFWTLGDGASVLDSATFDHTYAAAGQYLVSMRLTNRCQLDTTLTETVTIFNPPAPPTIPGAAALCNGPVTLDANTGGVPGLTYLWNDGSTGQTLVINVQSIISVDITDLNGCTSTGSSLIGDNRPQLDLGPDPTMCQNTFAPALDALNPGTTYQWTVTGVNSPGLTTNQTRALVTTLPTPAGTPDHYQVIVTDPVTLCTLTEDLLVTIIASPSFGLNGTNLTGCNMATPDGTLTVTIAATIPATGPYSIFVTGPAGFNDQRIDQTVAPPAITYTTLDAGTYSAVVQDQISGCTISQSFGLSENAFTANAVANAPNCDPVSLQVTTIGTTPASFPVAYRVLDSTAPVDIGTGAASPFATNPITVGNYNGTYTIELTDAGGCLFAINNFAITPNPPINITFTNSLCTSPATITAVVPSPGTSTFSWSTGAATATTTIPSSGTYTVTVTEPASCPTTLPTTVVVDNPVADFTQSDPCQDNVILTASPSGTYTYRWYANGSGTVTAIGQFLSLTIADDGDLYESEVFSTLSGCTSRSAPPKAVQVIGLVDNSGVTSTPPCKDGQPFILTAHTTSTGVAFAWFRDNVAIPGETAVTTSQTIEGFYRVEISKSICVKSSGLGITRADLPEGELPDRVVICNDPENTDPSSSQVDLDPGVFTKYDWFKNELSLGYTAQVLTADSEGRYRVDLTNAAQCVAPDEVDVLNDCQPVIVAPNAFRPTSSIDTNKDFFIISNFITDDFSIFIYNRWGELIFTSHDKDFKWNGGVNNTLSQPAPGGSYSYVIRYVSTYRPEKGVQERRGGVALLR